MAVANNIAGSSIAIGCGECFSSVNDSAKFNGDTNTVKLTSSIADIQFSGIITSNLQRSQSNSSPSDYETDEVVKAVCYDVTDSNDCSAQFEMNDDHYSIPDEHCSIEELQKTIEKYKVLAKNVVPHTNQAKEVVSRLVQLRLRLFEVGEKTKDLSEDTSGSEHAQYNVMGHRFERCPWISARGYCERCNGVIVSIIQPWCKCSNCGYSCHMSCLNQIARQCVSCKVSNSAAFILLICPEKGLHAQSYKCAECHRPIGFQPGLFEPRLCDYNGLYYCNFCHWNDMMVIPARVVNNWDFEPRKLCRASKQFLKLMLHKPLLRIEDLNPMLFNYLQELNEKLREDITIMKQYFLQCPSALGSKLLCQLSGRQHFVDNSDMYCLQDLIDVANDLLLPEITQIHANFAQHIKTDCQTCRQKGAQCRLCDSDEVLFSFESFSIACSVCSTIYHRHCYVSRNRHCTVCSQRTP